MLVPDPSRGVIALTFDDGPHPTYTKQVLDILLAHGAKATFFVKGSAIGGNESLLERMVAQGHGIGNHTLTHRSAVAHDRFATCAGDCLREELLETQARIRMHQPSGPNLFRFPWGFADCPAMSIVRDELDQTVVGWDIDSLDWDFADGLSADAIGHERDLPGWVVDSAELRGGGVLLMHDVHRTTAESLDEILSRLEERGFSFVSLDRENFPRLFAGPEEFRFLGPITAIPDANEGGVAVPISVEPSIAPDEVVVHVRIRHPRASDVVLELERHGQRFGLDESYRTSSTEGFGGDFPIPELDHVEASGEWTLWVSDRARSERGTLHAWSVTLTKKGEVQP